MQVHLFDIDIPGKITFKESETLTQGENFTVVDTPACRMGIGICYDMRFPELAMVYAQRGVRLIVYPGSFINISAEIMLLLHSEVADYHTSACMLFGHPPLSMYCHPTVCSGLLPKPLRISTSWARKVYRR